MPDVKMKTCPRCRGTGNVGGPVVYAGMPGGCFTCAMAGQIPVDKFYREMGTSGKYFGISYPYKPCAGPDHRKVTKIIKNIVRTNKAPEKMLAEDYFEGTTVTEITEEQARAFWKKYGRGTEVNP